MAILQAKDSAPQSQADSAWERIRRNVLCCQLLPGAMISNLMDEVTRGFNEQCTKPEIKHDNNAMLEAFSQADAAKASRLAPPAYPRG